MPNILTLAKLVVVPPISIICGLCICFFKYFSAHLFISSVTYIQQCPHITWFHELLTSSALPQEHFGCPWGLSVQMFHSLMVSSLSYIQIPIQLHTNPCSHGSHILDLYTYSHSYLAVVCLCLRNIAATWPCRLSLGWHSRQPSQWVQLESPHRPSWPRPTHQCTLMWEDRCTPVVSLRSLNTQNLGKTHTLCRKGSKWFLRHNIRRFVHTIKLGFVNVCMHIIHTSVHDNAEEIATRVSIQLHVQTGI